MKRIEQFNNGQFQIPSFELGVGDWVTIIFPNDYLSDQKLFIKKFPKSFLDDDFLDVRPWIKMNFPKELKYDEGILKLISQNINKKNFY